MARKKKELDQLDIDSSEAIKAGMSYGKYMALKKPAKTKPAKATTHEIEGYKHICQHCGKEFLAYNKKERKYCSDYCREQYYKKMKQTEPEAVEKTCPICGKVFMAQTFRNKYCCEFCKKVGQGQRAKEYQARKAMEVMP